MLTYIENFDIFSGSFDARINTVNCVGAAGAGIAKRFAETSPAYLAAYRKACGIYRDCNGNRSDKFGPQPHQPLAPCFETGCPCKVHQVKPGAVNLYRTADNGFIISLPTKRHWKTDSLLCDVDSGLAATASILERHAGEISTVAMPPPGCGNGNLRWSDVKPLIDRHFATLAAKISVALPKRH